MPGRPSRRLLRLATPLVAAAIFASCDIGDGTTLRDPVAPTTLPPPDTTPLDMEPLDGSELPEPVLDGGQAFDTVPDVPTIPPAAEAPAGEAVTTGFRVFPPWEDGASIDTFHTCDGAGASPALSWTDVPDGTQELAISLVDRSNLSNGRPFIHWVLAGIDPNTDRIDENEVPAGAVRGINFFGDVGYTGPCPDPGTTGTFTLTIVALGQQLELADATPAAELLDVISTVAIAEATSTATATR